MATLYSPKIPTDGLVLLIDPANNKSYPLSGTNVTDLSRNNLVGSLNGGVPFSSSFGGTFGFNGSSQFINFGDVLDQIGSDMSGAIWVNMSPIAGFTPLFDKLGTAGNFRFIVSGQQLGMGVRDTINGYSQVFSATALSYNTWYHLAFTLTSTNVINMYINGRRNFTDTTSLTLTRGDTTTPLRIGYSANNTTYLSGSIGPACLYNRILTDSEVYQLYSSTRGRFGV